MENFYTFQGKKIRYKIAGEGKAIVLLHGFTESMEIWYYYQSILSKENTVVIVDLPGHGKSECLGEIHSMELVAECIHELLSELKIFKYIIIGHSMGGYISLAMAEIFPKSIMGLGLFHSSATEDSQEIKDNRAKTIEFVKNNHQSFIHQFIPQLFAPENIEKFKTEIEELQNRGKQMNAQSIIAAIEGMKMRKSRIEILCSLNIPFLFIVGKKDSRIKFENLLAQMALPKHSHSLILDNVGHMGYIEDKEIILKTIVAFCKIIFN